MTAMRSIVVVMILLLSTVALSQHSHKHAFNPTETWQTRYEKSRTDTLILSDLKVGVGVSMQWDDSVQIKPITVRRLVFDVANKLGAGDTLYAAFADTHAVSISFTFTPTPLVDVYWIMIPYDTLIGVTTNTVRYRFIKP